MTDKYPTPHPPQLLDQVRDRLCLKHYIIRPEQACVDGTKRFIGFHDKRHPRETGDAETVAWRIPSTTFPRARR
jgi:hypothetical protein